MTRSTAIILTLINIPSGLGYPALGGLVAAESMGVPVPGETALIAPASSPTKANCGSPW